MTRNPEQHQFQTEIQQLLQILIFSLYTKREIFIREIISNASDALEKLRFLQSTNQDLLQPELPLEIRIDLDPERRVFSVADTGTGMTRDELVANIGTIARSGSLDFVRHLVGAGGNADEQEVELIGQFGVGFYSAFMVASEVRVQTRSCAPDSEAWEWVSDGASGYTISESSREKRGTTIEMVLKEGTDEFLDPGNVERIVRRYSNFIAYPIILNGKRANEVAPLWSRSPAEVSKDDYHAFFSWLTGSTEPPDGYVHIRSDAPLSVRSLLFIPPVNLEQLGLGKVEHGLQLYTRKVLIDHECRDLLPDYLRFVRGVVDSEDLTLNVSREAVQDDRVIRKLKKFLTKKVLAHLEELRKKDRKAYERFHARYGRMLREGVANEFENRETLANLLLFGTSFAEDTLTDLDEYVQRMRDRQEEIYYLAGPDRAALETSPHLEMFRARGIEVLYLFDPADDFVLGSLGLVRGKKIVSADQADPSRVQNVELIEPVPPEEEKETLAARSAFDHLLDRFREVLKDRVQDVRESKRLTESPCVMVSPQDGPSAQVQNVMRMIQKDYIPAKRILEVNARHPLIRTLAGTLKESPTDSFVNDVVEQLYDNALIQEGMLPDPSRLVSRILAIMQRAAGG